MTIQEDKILKQYLSLVAWSKRARDSALLGNKDKTKEALEGVRKCLVECEGLNESSSQSNVAYR